MINLFFSSEINHIYMFPGDGKQKREGPCVGTKGFRAPEVRNCDHFCFNACTTIIISHSLFILILAHTGGSIAIGCQSGDILNS